MSTTTSTNGAAPQREWVTFDDPVEDGRRWQLDVTFLTSRWQCIYGCGCQGVRDTRTPERYEGCCSYGAHFVDAKDRDRVVRISKQLRPDEWQHRAEGRRRGVVAKTGSSWRTRRVDDACIFLNRPGFEGGPGCALHVLAQRLGVHFADTKPEVCWQLPLRRVDNVEDDGSVTSVVTEFARSGWGEGGDDFAWWCTEAPEAFTATEPVYRSLEPELRRTCGDAVYERLATYLDARMKSSMAPIAHPAERPVRLGPTRRRAAKT
jgi:hypothetical protein